MMSLYQSCHQTSDPSTTCARITSDFSIHSASTSSPGVPFVMRWKNRSPSLTKKIAASGNEFDSASVKTVLLCDLKRKKIQFISLGLGLLLFLQTPFQIFLWNKNDLATSPIHLYPLSLTCQGLIAHV